VIATAPAPIPPTVTPDLPDAVRPLIGGRAPSGTDPHAGDPVSQRQAIIAAISGTKPGPVVVAFDGTPLAERSVQVAATLARARDATLVLIRAVPGTARHGMFAYILEDRAHEVEDARADLRRVANEVRSVVPGVRVEVAIADGAPEPAVVAAMRAANPALAVVSTRGRPMVARTFGGSVAGAVVRDVQVPTLVLWPAVVAHLTADEWRDDTLATAPTGPVGRRVLLPMPDAIKHPRLAAEAFRLAADAGGEVVLLVGPSAVMRESAARLAAAAATVDVKARVALAPATDWVGIVGAIAREACDVVAIPPVADLPGTRPGLGRVHRDVATRATVPLLCAPDLPFGERHGLAALYPDLPLPLLDVIGHLETR
jgi:nucleotide-binding universal stress UspA family protein